MVNFFSKTLKMFRAAAYSRRGQFLLPSVLLVPIVLLVIYLIYETAKLSREKIRQQFAVDAAAFVELQPAATYLNASAYINAAFPYRVFRDNMNTPLKFSNRGGQDERLTVYDWFYRGGAFPGSVDRNDENAWNPKDTDLEWNLKYSADPDADPVRSRWEVESPQSAGSAPVTLMSKTVADHYEADETLLYDSLWFYVTVYGLFGDIFDKQGAIYNKISTGGMFFKKSYYLNTGTCNEDECGREGAQAFSGLSIKLTPFYIRTMKLVYSDFFYGGSQRYQTGTQSLSMPVEKLVTGGNLFQFAYLDSGSRRTLGKLKSGIEVTQPFTPPDNYFNVDLRGYTPHVHATVSLECPAASNNCVWPKATSKYQVRMEP
ncbi:MAG: hypothetical protein FWF35_01030 [Elusimicrobia bacterium]|nr:hypothetical protein [Elusimicrobiota bacterium]